MRRTKLIVLLLLLAVALPLVRAGAGRADTAVVPYQWIAKTHTEGLGRMPTQDEWQADVDYFGGRGCSAATLAERGRERYLSSAFLALAYDGRSRLLAAYRGLLNDEPDRTSFDARAARLDGAAPWAEVLDELLADSRFAQVATKACGANPNYYFGANPPLRLPVAGTGFTGGTSVELQAILDATAPGGTVWLAERAVVTITKPLVVPANVSLATVGLPEPREYTRMARLVRMLPAAAAGQPVVEVRGGGDLLSLWIDGQRGPYRNNAPTGQQVMVYGGTGSRIEHNVLSNTAGPTALGTLTAGDCRQQVVRGNLVTLYTTDHFDNAWADGLTIGCEDSIVEDNEVVDATDVSIIVFTAAPYVQRSIVRNNRVLQAGNSAYAGLAVTEGYKTASTFAPNPDFTGTRFEDNLLWTSAKTHFDFGLSVGIRAWYGDDTHIGRGSVFVRNTTGSQKVRANNGIVVTGQYDVTVLENTIDTEIVQTNICPTAVVAASVSAGYTSGQIQPYSDVPISACLIGGADERHKDRHGAPSLTDLSSMPSFGPATVTEELQRPDPGAEPIRTPGAAQPGWQTAEATITAGNGVSSVTMTEFQTTCVAPPPSQGLDAWIFDVRPGATAVRVESNGPSGQEVVVAYYWTQDCRYLGMSPTWGSGINDSAVPAGTAYVAIHLAAGARANVALHWRPPAPPAA